MLDSGAFGAIVHACPAGAAVLVGHSLGALVAMRAAAADSGRVAGLVLTGAFHPPARDGRSTLATAADYARHRVLFAAEVLGRSGARRGVVRAPLLTPLRSLARLGLRPEVFHTLGDGVGCPVLVVHGGDDHHVPVAFARASVRRHPAWRLEVLPRSGHFAHRDAPGAWIAAVTPWLSGLGLG